MFPFFLNDPVIFNENVINVIMIICYSRMYATITEEKFIVTLTIKTSGCHDNLVLTIEDTVIF